MLSSFFDLNRRACAWIEDRLPTEFTLNFNRVFEQRVADFLAEIGDEPVLDVGGGKHCFFSEFRRPGSNTRIIAFDIDEDELRQNTVVDDKVLGDATRALPFANDALGLITTRSLLEHLSDTENFIRDAVRVLRPGGVFVHLCPGKFAPFALINQAIPMSLAKRILYYFHPSFRAECGFPAYYKNTYYTAIKQLLEQYGYKDIEIKLRYNQSLYFNFFVPFYLCSITYDLIIYLLGIKNLASQLLIVAKK